MSGPRDVDFACFCCRTFDHATVEEGCDDDVEAEDYELDAETADDEVAAEVALGFVSIGCC